MTNIAFNKIKYRFKYNITNVVECLSIRDLKIAILQYKVNIVNQYFHSRSLRNGNKQIMSMKINRTYPHCKTRTVVTIKLEKAFQFNSETRMWGICRELITFHSRINKRPRVQTNFPLITPFFPTHLPSAFIRH